MAFSDKKIRRLVERTPLSKEQPTTPWLKIYLSTAFNQYPNVERPSLPSCPLAEKMCVGSNESDITSNQRSTGYFKC